MSNKKINKVTKAITDFIEVEDGNIAKKSMLMTATILTATIAGQVIMTSEAFAHSEWSLHGEWSKNSLELQ